MLRKGLLLGLATALVVGLATPAVAAPELQLSPATGSAGDTFTVRGTGFAASDVEIRWGSQSGDLLTTAAGPDFEVDATVPDVGPNSYPVVAVVREGGSVSTSNASFQVAPAVQTTGRAATSPPGRGGGIDGGLPDTTSGVDADPDPPTVTTAPATTTPATTPTTTAPAVTAATVLPTTVVSAPDAEAAAVPGGSAASTSTVAGRATAGEERGAGLRPASTSRSSGAVQSPALLVVGLVLVVAGALALLVRSRRPRGGQ